MKSCPLEPTRQLKLASFELKTRFCTHAQTLLHGDLHTGSVMVSATDTRVIDAEFATYGPMGFDIGALLGNFWIAFFAQSGSDGDADTRSEQARWLLDCAAGIWMRFVTEFTHLWRTERAGILGGREIFEAQRDGGTPDKLLKGWLDQAWEDALGYAGIEIYRRILGFAHVADLESIEDPVRRATCEKQALRAGRQLATRRREFRSIESVTSMLCDIQGAR